MNTKVEKYIYFISENRYRVKFLKVDKKENKRINFDEYIDGKLEDAIKLRDDKLKENGLTLNPEEKKDLYFGTTDEPEEPDDFSIKNDKPKKVKNTSNLSSKKSESLDKVDKYIYEIEKGKKYKIFIRKGNYGGQKGDYYSAIFIGTLAQARKERDKKIAELSLKNNNALKGNIKFIDFVRLYYKEYAEKELSPLTIAGGKMELRNYILPEIANVPLNKVDALTIQKIINNLKDRDCVRKDKDGNTKKLSPTTVNGIYRCLRKIFNKAVLWDYIESNPVTKVKCPSVSNVEKKSYNVQELINILELLKKEDALTEALFTLAICTGLRRGEILGLHVEDIDFDNNVVKVNRAVVWDYQNKKIVEKATKTKGSVREVPIPSFCADCLKEYLKLRERIIRRFEKSNIDYVAPNNLFLGRNGGIMFPDSPSSKWRDFTKRHNIKKYVSFHGLRHSYCSMQMNDNSNLSPADVQKLMGHSQLSTTFIYTHSNREMKKEALSIFDKYYNCENPIDNDGERKISFDELVTLYTGIKFTKLDVIEELTDYMIPENCSINEKMKKIKDYIDNKYPEFRYLDVSNVNINNLWDWLEEGKNKYGNEFIITPIKSFK